MAVLTARQPAVPRNEMGFIDPVRESCGSAQGSVARRGFSQETIRASHLYATAAWIERELGDERQLNLFDGPEADGNNSRCPMARSPSASMAVRSGGAQAGMVRCVAT